MTSDGPVDQSGTSEADTLDGVGIRYGIDQASSGHNYLSTYESELSDTAITTLVIISGTKPVETGTAFAQFYRDALVHVLNVRKEPAASPLAGVPDNLRVFHCPSLADMQRELLAIGPVDVIIEDGTNKKSQKLACFKEFL